MIIRLALYSDLKTINDIYNQSIPSKTSTADLTPVSLHERKKWFETHNDNKYPVFISEVDGIVAGWISLSPYRQGREALRFTAEVSYYIHSDFQRRGIGSALLEYVINNIEKYQIKNLFAILLETNIGSIKLLEKFGFERWGYMPNVADFYGKECGQFYYGLRLPWKK